MLTSAAASGYCVDYDVKMEQSASNDALLGSPRRR